MKKGAMIFAIVSALSCFGRADAVAPFYNDSTQSLSDRIILSNAPIYSFFSLPYENPGARQYQAPFSISRIYAGYQSDVSEKAVASADGKGQRLWEVGADSYLKYKSSTLWGAAFYNNGKVLSPVWNETSDAALLYPYLTADSVGGDMNLERYSFMGGYADHSGKWSWGVEIGYLAGLYYRSVDPRPKNITGLLSLKGGAGYMLTPVYNLAVGLSASRYQQSNEISFVSETYESKIYHSTGLGTHYVRFAGTGKNSRYAGWRYGASLGLTPTASPGFVAAVSAEWFRFEKTLLDLNRLPLVEASDFDIKGEVGYRGVSGNNVWMIGAAVISHARKGKENIFGDPSMSIYPQISSLDKFSASNFEASLSALWSLQSNGLPVFSVKPSVSYSSRNESYVTPDRSADVDALLGSLVAQGCFRLPWSISAIASVNGEIYSPVSSSLKTDGVHLNDDEGLIGAWLDDFEYDKSSNGRAGISLYLSRPLTDKFSLAVDVKYSRMFLPFGNSGNIWGVDLSVLF